MDIIPNSFAIVLVASLIGVLGAFQVHRYIGHRDAATAFRAVFNPDIAELADSARLPEIYVFLRSNFHRHNAAVLELSSHLGWFARHRLRQDWVSYAKDADEIRQRYDAPSGTTEADARRTLAVKRLQKVVSHAK